MKAYTYIEKGRFEFSDKPQMLPLPDMYGKNLTFRTGGVDGCDCAEILTLIEEGKIDTTPLITHSFPLSRIDEAYRLLDVYILIDLPELLIASVSKVLPSRTLMPLMYTFSMPNECCSPGMPLRSLSSSNIVRSA